MFGKFFASTFTGSMFGAGPDVFALWGYVVANTVDSTVELNPKHLAAVLGTTEARVMAALEFLCAPDLHSRTKTDDGRRLRHEGGYQYHVINHSHYRALRNEEDRRIYNREAKRRERLRRGIASPGVIRDITACQHLSAQAETEAESDTETETHTHTERVCETPVCVDELETGPTTSPMPELPQWLSVWNLWRDVAEAHGHHEILHPSIKAQMHCTALAQAYSLPDLEAALRAWWTSAHVHGRNLGLFVSQVAEVMAHVQAGHVFAFRAPPKERERALQMAAERASAARWGIA